MTTAGFLHAYAAIRAAALPLPRNNPTPPGDIIRCTLGQNWSVHHDRRWWAEVHLAAFGWEMARISDADGNPLEVPFPKFPGAPEVADRAASSTVPGLMTVRSSGWPWRTWLVVSSISPNSAGRRWKDREMPLLSGVAGAALLSATVGSAAGCGLWAWGTSIKRRLCSRSGVCCGGCGYDLSGLKRDICPECGEPLNTNHRSISCVR